MQTAKRKGNLNRQNVKSRYRFLQRLCKQAIFFTQRQSSA